MIFYGFCQRRDGLKLPNYQHNLKNKIVEYPLITENLTVINSSVA